MKLQYLGDSKDCFKWDYHDYLVNTLAFKRLNIVLMMTPDDGGAHGSSRASLFPARSELIDFCEALKAGRDIQLLRQLPKVTASRYKVDLHSKDQFPNADRRQEYFDGFSSELDQVILVDPDNGFEPKKSFSDKHLLFSELDRILNQISDASVISVFQYFRRKPFERDFLEIRERLYGGFATAVYWHSLMFVLVTRTPDVLARIIQLNKAYASEQPVKVIA